MRAPRQLLTIGLVLIVAACSPAIASPSPVTPATSAPATPSPVADLPSALREILRAPGPYQKLVADVQVDYARKGGPATGDVVWTLGADTVHDRFDMVGDVATSWAWTDEATP